MSEEVKKTCAEMEFPRILKEIKESPLHFSSQARVVPGGQTRCERVFGIGKTMGLHFATDRKRHPPENKKAKGSDSLDLI